MPPSPNCAFIVAIYAHAPREKRKPRALTPTENGGGGNAVIVKVAKPCSGGMCASSARKVTTYSPTEGAAEPNNCEPPTTLKNISPPGSAN